jgi:hypothetical protein
MSACEQHLAREITRGNSGRHRTLPRSKDEGLAAGREDVERPRDPSAAGPEHRCRGGPTEEGRGRQVSDDLDAKRNDRDVRQGETPAAQNTRGHHAAIDVSRPASTSSASQITVSEIPTRLASARAAEGLRSKDAALHEDAARRTIAKGTGGGPEADDCLRVALRTVDLEEELSDVGAERYTRLTDAVDLDLDRIGHSIGRRRETEHDVRRRAVRGQPDDAVPAGPSAGLATLVGGPQKAADSRAIAGTTYEHRAIGTS